MREDREPGAGIHQPEAHRAEFGFSLVEWTISIVLLAMLAGGAFLLFQVIANTSERSEAQTSMDEYAETVADALRSVGWVDCYGAQGGLYDYFSTNLAARMTGTNPIVKPASTQGDGSASWAVQDPVIEDVYVGSSFRAVTWERVPKATDPPNPNLQSCSNYFVARVTFVVRNYDPNAAEQPSIPIEIRRQVFITRS